MHFLYDVGDRKGFAAAGNTQKGLLMNAIVQTTDQLTNGFGLIARWFVVRNQFKLHGLKLPINKAPEGALLIFSY